MTRQKAPLRNGGGGVGGAGGAGAGGGAGLNGAGGGPAGYGAPSIESSGHFFLPRGFGGGGGGGYTGVGGGGGSLIPAGRGGGGRDGGSYLSSRFIDPVLTFRVNSGNGFVIIELITPLRGLTTPSVRVAYEHIYWDQATLLVQVGLLDPTLLPVSGAEQAKRLLDPREPANELIARARGKTS